MSYDLKIKNGDLSIQNGDIETVSNTDKLVQDILKIALTNVGANPLVPYYGSFVSKSLIGSVLPSRMTVQIAQSQLQNAIEILVALQKAQIQSFQSVSPDELIGSILDISINKSNQDPRLYNINIKVLSKSFKVATANFSVNI